MGLYNKTIRKGVTVTWRDMSIYILDFHHKICKQIIHNIKGAVRPGELTAILGSSGSGKSSLITALAFRHPKTLTVQGDIRVDGLLIDESYMRRNSGFMHQDDLFVETMTVSEHLWFMARMKLGNKITESEIDRKIVKLLNNVGMSFAINIIIGNTSDTKVLSGGEKKRLSFATELLTDPLILFLDEPTTGQDASTANILVDQLQSFAKLGRTVFCTIHQPNSTVFSSFEKIIIVADGKVAFAGTRDDATAFFSSLGYVCPHLYNPADYFLNILAVSSRIDYHRSNRILDRICNAFLSSNSSKEIDLILQLEAHMAEVIEQKKTCASLNGSKKFWLAFKKLSWLINRGLVQVLRDPSVQFLRFLQKITVAVIAGLCFFGEPVLDQYRIQTVQGVIFIIVSENTFFPMYSTLSLIPQELPLFLREYKAGIYSVHLYYTARVISLLPGFLLEPALFTYIIFWFSGLSSVGTVFYASLCVVILLLNVSTACGFFFSTAFENVSLAMVYLVPFDYLLMITMGSFIKLSSLSAYIRWIRYISWLYLSSESLSILQWKNIENISCQATATELPCIKSGREVLKFYDFAQDNLELDVSLMILMYFLFHILGYLFLLKLC